MNSLIVTVGITGRKYSKRVRTYSSKIKTSEALEV